MTTSTSVRDPFGAMRADWRRLGAGRPRQKGGRDEQHAHGVGEPPARPHAADVVRRREIGEPEARHADRRSDGRRGEGAEAHESDDVTRAREASIEADRFQEPDFQRRLQGAAAGRHDAVGRLRASRDVAD